MNCARRFQSRQQRLRWKRQADAVGAWLGYDASSAREHSRADERADATVDARLDARLDARVLKSSQEFSRVLKSRDSHRWSLTARPRKLRGRACFFCTDLTSASRAASRGHRFAQTAWINQQLNSGSQNGISSSWIPLCDELPPRDPPPPPPPPLERDESELPSSRVYSPPPPAPPPLPPTNSNESIETLSFERF